MLFQYPLELRNCPILTYAVCCEDIKSGKTFFIFSEGDIDIIFRSTFNKELGLQFFMNLLSLCFFSTNLSLRYN